MMNDENVVQFPGPEFLLQCDCGRIEFGVLVSEAAPFKVEFLECTSCGWQASVDDVMTACELGETIN